MSVSRLECNGDCLRGVVFVQVPCSKAQGGDGSDGGRSRMIAGLERKLLLGRRQPEEGQGNRGRLRNGGHHSISMFLTEQDLKIHTQIYRYIVEDGALNCPVFLLLRIV